MRVDTMGGVGNNGELLKQWGFSISLYWNLFHLDLLSFGSSFVWIFFHLDLFHLRTKETMVISLDHRR